MPRKPMTVTYVISYALLWPDTWQIACGLVAAWLLTPKLAPTGAGVPTVVVSYGMLAAIGYAASGMILRPLFRRLHAWMLRRRRA